jgi:hypothetical protein
LENPNLSQIQLPYFGKKCYHHIIQTIEFHAKEELMAKGQDKGKDKDKIKKKKKPKVKETA